MTVKRILILDGETGFVQSLRHNLELEGHEVLVEPDGRWGVTQSRAYQPDLVIIDLSLLQDGQFGVLVESAERPPVLVLSSRPEEASRVQGFQLGRDDFIIRPVSIVELHRRIDSLLHGGRSPNGSGAPPPLVEEVTHHFGEVEVRAATRTVMRRGEPVSLRLKEFDLLMALLAREGRVATRADLLREVWGYRTWVATRTVDTHVAELRRKLEDDASTPRHILTVRKIGYRLQR